jgi:hypothetical protein
MYKLKKEINLFLQKKDILMASLFSPPKQFLTVMFYCLDFIYSNSTLPNNILYTSTFCFLFFINQFFASHKA